MRNAQAERAEQCEIESTEQQNEGQGMRREGSLLSAAPSRDLGIFIDGGRVCVLRVCGTECLLQRERGSTGPCWSQMEKTVGKWFNGL